MPNWEQIIKGEVSYTDSDLSKITGHDEELVHALYSLFVEAWNARDAKKRTDSIAAGWKKLDKEMQDLILARFTYEEIGMLAFSAHITLSGLARSKGMKSLGGLFDLPGLREKVMSDPDAPPELKRMLAEDDSDDDDTDRPWKKEGELPTTKSSGSTGKPDIDKLLKEMGLEE